jgi:hypothetical protein
MILTDDTGSFLNITSWSFTGSIRELQDDTTPDIANFSIQITSMQSASLALALYPVSSSLLSKKKYYYDIIATNIIPNPPEVYRLVQGKISTNAAVTTL